MKRFWNLEFLIKAIGFWLAASIVVVEIIALFAAPPNARAILFMGLGLVLLWVGLGGWLMRRYRNPIREWVLVGRLDWRIKFVLMATALALIEEAITTTMTNLAPLFGVPVGAAYITASTNYWDVVCLHSVVVFVPMFVGWAVMLRFIDFSPNAVFLLFGLTGVLSEMSLSGVQALAEAGLWIFVYGLMVYLPAYTLPVDRGAKKARWWHYAAAIFLPVLFSMPVAAVIATLHPIPIHFPPVLPGT